jgi:hypothetical protein
LQFICFQFQVLVLFTQTSRYGTAFFTLSEVKCHSDITALCLQAVFRVSNADRRQFWRRMLTVFNKHFKAVRRTPFRKRDALPYRKIPTVRSFTDVCIYTRFEGLKAAKMSIMTWSISCSGLPSRTRSIQLSSSF